MNQLDLSDVAFITEDMHNSMARSALQPGDVLLNITGASIGRTAVVPPELKIANVNPHVCRMRFVVFCNPHFISYYLASERGQEQILGSQYGATRQGLNYAQVRAMWIPCPPKTEEDEIASALLGVEQKLASERNRRKALEVLFNSLLHHLMTGKVRVNELEFPAMKEGGP